VNLDKIEKLVKIIENSSMLDFSIQEGDVKNGTVMAQNEQKRKCWSACCTDVSFHTGC